MSCKKTFEIATSARFAAILLGFALAATNGPARADWLVLRSGDAVETKGSWSIEGAKVLFTNSRGVLSSVRATEVDIDASRALTTKKQEQATAQEAAPTPTPKRTPVLVLTDKDFEKSAPVGTPAPAGTEPAEASPAGTLAGQGSAPPAAARPARAAPPAAPSGPPVEVPAADSLETRVAHQMPGPAAIRITSWSARPTGQDQLSIFGTVQNVGSRVTAAIDVEVTLFDSEDVKIGSTEAAVSATALMPSVSADFEARFDGDPNFAEVQMTVKTVEIELGTAPEGEALDQPEGDEPHATTKGAPARAPAPASQPQNGRARQP